MDPQSMQRAREAAQQARISVGEWLDGVILGNAAAESAPPGRSGAIAETATQQPEQALASRFGEIRGRLESLRVRIDRLADGGTALQCARPRHQPPPDAVPSANPDQPRVSAPTPSLAQAVREIAERQRALDTGATRHTPPAALEALPRRRTRELSGLAHQLRQINERMEALKQPCALARAVDTLRDDLAEIGAMVERAMPRQAIEALENEVGSLAARLEDRRNSGGDLTALGAIEAALKQMREALHRVTPAERLVGIDRTLQELSRKIDLLPASVEYGSALREIESQIAAIRTTVAAAASGEGLAILSEDMRELSRRIDQIPGVNLLSGLEERIALLADRLAARNPTPEIRPDELEHAVKRLVDRMESVRLAPEDHPTLGELEDWVELLVKKLDDSQRRLEQLETLERAVGGLRSDLDRQRTESRLAAAMAPAPELLAVLREMAELRETEQKTQGTLELVHRTLTGIVDRLATIEVDLLERLPTTILSDSPAPIGQAAPPPLPGLPANAGSQPFPRPSQPSGLPLGADAVATGDRTTLLAQPNLPAADRRPIDPSLPSNHPLEPRATRARNSPADRIAASQAAIAESKPPIIADPGGASNFIAAARRAAQAAGRGTVATNDPSAASEIGKLAISRMVRMVVVGVSALLLLLGFQIGRTLITSSDVSGMNPRSAPSEAAAARRTQGVPAAPSLPPGSGEAVPPTAVPALPGSVPAGGRSSVSPAPIEAPSLVAAPTVAPSAAHEGVPAPHPSSKNTSAATPKWFTPAAREGDPESATKRDRALASAQRAQ